MAKIPEITDADMAFQAEETNNKADQKPFYKQYKLFHATFAQFCYTGSQVAIASFFINYCIATRPGTGSKEAARLFAGAQAAFAVGRFFGVGLMKYVKPRLCFLAFLLGAIIFVCPSITQGGNIGVSMLYVVLFFESICFPTIVALGMRGLGRHTKRGSGYIVGGVIGGACVPPLTGGKATLNVRDAETYADSYLSCCRPPRQRNRDGRAAHVLPRVTDICSVRQLCARVRQGDRLIP